MANNSTQHSGNRERGRVRREKRWNLNWNVGRIILSRAIASENEKMGKLCCYIKTQKSILASFHIDVENFNCFAEEEVIISTPSSHFECVIIWSCNKNERNGKVNYDNYGCTLRGNYNIKVY